jgi:glycosyltransferase involved in cell wall biosynthesis
MLNSSIPLVSIGMPVFNCERTLELAIRSIFLQTYENWELLIIDDGSSDNTVAIARTFNDPRIKIWADGSHKGLPARLNEAISYSRGKYFARMDGDDIAYPQRLERQVAFLEEHPEIDLVGSWMLVFGRNGVALGKRIGPQEHSKLYSLVRSISIGHPTFLGKLSWFKEHKYLEWPKHFQDQYLLLSTFQQSRFSVLPEILLGYREERLSIAKLMRYRFSYILCLPKLLSSLGLLQSFVLIGAQFLKLGLDIFAIGTGLNYRILRHRALPLTDQERFQWMKVWILVNQRMGK